MDSALCLLAGRVKSALTEGDLDQIRLLLAPDVRWGGPEPSAWDCQDREQVLQWWGRAREEGVRARVTEVAQGASSLLVGLAVTGRDGEAAEERRWQVLTVREGLVVDIRGFDERAPAAAAAGISAQEATGR